MERGQRFKAAVRSQAAVIGLHTDEALADAAGITSNTLRNWWQGKGLELGSLAAVGGVLDQSVFDLLNVWQGRKPPKPEPSIAVAISALADELRTWRTEDRERLEAVERTVEGLLGDDPTEPAAAESRAPRAPRETAE